jgi:hypothetical protein
MNLLSRFRKKAPLVSVECAPLQLATFKPKARGAPVQGLCAGDKEPLQNPQRLKLTGRALQSNAVASQRLNSEDIRRVIQSD